MIIFKTISYSNKKMNYNRTIETNQVNLPWQFLDLHLHVNLSLASILN